MAKGIYVGVSNKAQKVKKLYVGVSNVARKVKKVYIGDVNGKARLAYINMPASIASLTNALYNGASATVGTNIIFVGHDLYTSSSKNAEVYNGETLTKLSIPQLTEALEYPSGTTVGGWAIFEGTTNVNATYQYICYNASLTRTQVAVWSKWYLGMAKGSATIGNYGIFGGGRNACNTAYNDGPKYAPYTLSINNSLTIQKTLSNLTDNLKDDCYYMQTASNGTYAYFTGMCPEYMTAQNAYSLLTVYNASLTRTICDPISTYRNVGLACKGANLDNIAIIGGTTSNTAVDFIDEKITRKTSSFTPRRKYGCGVANDKVFFAGGYYHPGWGTTTYIDTVEAFNKSMTKYTNIESLSSKGSIGATGSYGDIVLFAGVEDNKIINAYNSGFDHLIST